MHEVDPRTLLVDLNVRRPGDAADADLVASIKDLGVLQAIRTVRTTDGTLRVETGHQRTLAAIAAGMETVPVVVVADERTDDAGTVERLVRQYAENEHRQGLTSAERVGVVEQLSLLNVSAAQIAKRTRIKRAEVDHALAVAGSDLARAAQERYDLTLDQASALAEFEDDTEAVKTLVAAAKLGRFEHALSTARQRRDEKAALARFAVQMEGEGVRVIQRPSWQGPARGMDRLTTSEDAEITTPNHAACAGHVAWAEERWVHVRPDGTEVSEDDDSLTDEEWEEVTVSNRRRLVAVYGCENPAKYGHKVDGRAPRAADISEAKLTDEEREAVEEGAREAKRQERRTTIANNKAWDAAQSVRHRWVKDHIAGRKSLPKSAAHLMVVALQRETYLLSDGAREAKALGWLSDDESTWLIGISDNRGQVLAFLLVLAAYEHHADRNSWRSDWRGSTGRYLLWLQEAGYVLSDVERLAAGLPVNLENQDDENA